MYTIRVTLAMTAAILVVLASPVQAQHPQMADQLRDTCLGMETRVEELESKLQEFENGTWPEALLAQYQTYACAMVYNAIAAHLMATDELPSDLHSLAGYYFTDWPLNPQNGWEEIEVLSPGSAFSPGELVYHECPLSYYSLGNVEDQYDLVPRSFELSIYGPSEGHFQGFSGSVTNEWSSVPPGSLAIFGVWTESANETLEKLRARHERELLAREIAQDISEEVE